MDREILFKAKRLDNGEWVESSLLFDGKDNYYIGTAIFQNDNAIDIVKGGRSNRKTLNRFKSIGFVMVDPKTICQYTGLTDKNGKKIWENDIVTEDFRNEKGIVRFGEFEAQVLKNMGFNIEWISSISYRQDICWWAGKCEVIGNIFDNKENDN